MVEGDGTSADESGNQPRRAEDRLHEEHTGSLFGEAHVGEAHQTLRSRGPDRRRPDTASIREPLARTAPLPPLTELRRLEPGRAVRLGRGDGIATALAVLGMLTFGTAIISGALILYNAKTVGAFGNPWDSTRVAIGLAVLAVGVIQSALLIGVSRAITYLLADLRLRAHELELQLADRSELGRDRRGVDHP